MSAPERIIADCGNVQSGTSDLCQWEHWGDLVEYNRTDLCDPMQDERVRRLVEAAGRILEDIDDMKEAFDGLAGTWLTTWDEMDPGGPMDAWMEGERMLRAALRALEQGEG